MMNHTHLAAHFERMHNNPPRGFNPDFDPKARARSTKVAKSMETDGFYSIHTREQCAVEFRRRYDELKTKGE